MSVLWAHIIFRSCMSAVGIIEAAKLHIHFLFSIAQLRRIDSILAQRMQCGDHRPHPTSSSIFRTLHPVSIARSQQQIECILFIALNPVRRYLMSECV